MNTEYLEEVLRSLDPTMIEDTETQDDRVEVVWRSIMMSLSEGTPKRFRRLEVSGAVGATVAAAAVLIVSLVSSPTDAVAATLRAAATADAPAALLPALTAGEYYYQESAVLLTCEVGSPSMAPRAAPLTYVSDGTMQSWTNASGAGSILISPSSVLGGGSHFATAKDEARWLALGKPFIPCALVNSSNQLIGNPANSDTGGALGGYSASGSGYGGFGLSLALEPRTSLVTSASSINNLPDSPTQIAALLANGQIGPDGSVSSSPQVCPLLDDSSTSTVGCSANEQLSVIEQLMQLPDASAKLGSVLYDVMSNLPGAKEIGSVATSSGVTGVGIEVPQGSNESFEVVLDQSTGALLSCSELITQDGTTSTLGSVNYGPVQVAQGQQVPTSTNQH